MTRVTVRGPTCAPESAGSSASDDSMPDSPLSPCVSASADSFSSEETETGNDVATGECTPSESVTPTTRSTPEFTKDKVLELLPTDSPGRD